MPLYYDLRNSQRKRCLEGGHLELACSFLEAIRGQNYSERGHFPDRNELSLEDLTDEVVVTWVLVRRFLVKNAAHGLFKHRDGLAKDHNHEDGGVVTMASGPVGKKMESMGHGHMTPPLFLLAETFPKNGKVTADGKEVERARRDLAGFIGLKTAAARGKFDTEEVFS